MVLVVLASHPPSVTTDDAVQLFDRANDGTQKFPEESLESSLAVIKYQVADAMGHLTDADTTEGRCHEVVDSWRLYLAGRLPHQTATEGIRNRLPEVHAIAASRIEVQSSMIGMSKQIGGELVVVPYEAILDVVADGVHRNLGEILIHDKLVEALHAHIDHEGFKGCLPWMLLLSGRVVGGIDLHQAVGCRQIESILQRLRLVAIS